MTKTEIRIREIHQMRICELFAARPADVEYVTLFKALDPMGEQIRDAYGEVIGPMTPADDESYLYRLQWREAHQS